jgi:hypothetical protein
MQYLRTLLLNLRELLIAVDQCFNVLVCLIGFQRGYSDESLSAHAWRAYRDGKPWGLLLMPPIDLLFFWQKPDPSYVDERGKPVEGHCRRAFLKERDRAYLPPEYRTEPGTKA